MSGLNGNGLTEFQRDLLAMTPKKVTRESFKIMRKIGSKARTAVAKEARAKVKKRNNVYHKRFKRGKVFKDPNDKIVVRVFNSAPHAHLIEHGHRQVTKDGREVGFVPGRKVLEHGAENFSNSGQFDDMLSEWLDDLLRSGGL